MRARRALAIVVSSLLASACTIVPLYHLPQDAAYAKVKINDDHPSGAVGLSMCVDDRRYRLSTDSKGYAEIPVGDRVALDVNYVSMGYRITLSCDASSSFVPAARQSYYVDFEVEGESCTALAYQQVSTNRVGLGFLSTLAPAPHCRMRR